MAWRNESSKKRDGEALRQVFRLEAFPPIHRGRGVDLWCGQRNRGSEHIEVALNGLGTGSVNFKKLNAHAPVGHVSHLRLDQHDSLFEGQARNQFNFVTPFER